MKGARGGTVGWGIATRRKMVGSIPYAVNGIFHWRNFSGRTIVPGSTQSLAEMSTIDMSRGVKASGAYGWQYYHLHVSIV